MIELTGFEIITLVLIIIKISLDLCYWLAQKIDWEGSEENG